MKPVSYTQTCGLRDHGEVVNLHISSKNAIWICPHKARGALFFVTVIQYPFSEILGTMVSISTKGFTLSKCNIYIYNIIHIIICITDKHDVYVRTSKWNKGSASLTFVDLLPENLWDLMSHAQESSLVIVVTTWICLSVSKWQIAHIYLYILFTVDNV